ncbi:hypothetical protein MAR_010650 [Mya arenaria]|uniref:Uncharacterized protein n=1 Tax=Mya arenaria TaxID=6604 RepID=A0ABY7FVS8_MYAAR|nr:hypothetical protein MAR_010650 [Mya arenaria]
MPCRLYHSPTLTTPPSSSSAGCTETIVAQPTYITSLGIPSPCTAHSLQTGRILFSVANSNKQYIQCDAAGNAHVG